MNEKIAIVRKKFDEMTEKLVKNSFTMSDLQVMGSFASILLAMMEFGEEAEEAQEELRDEIKDELMGAEHYYQKWVATNDPDFEAMAHDELRHAEFFIKEAQEHAKAPVELARVKSMIEWHNTILAKLQG